MHHRFPFWISGGVLNAPPSATGPVTNRLVHQAVKQVLEPVLEPGFSDDSFGFRPGRSVPGALQAVTHALSHSVEVPAPFTVAVKLDIADCFPSIDHRQLLAALERQVADQDLLRLLARLCEAGGETVRRLGERHEKASPLKPDAQV